MVHFGIIWNSSKVILASKVLAHIFPLSRADESLSSLALHHKTSWGFQSEIIKQYCVVVFRSGLLKEYKLALSIHKKNSLKGRMCLVTPLVLQGFLFVIL